MGLFQYLIALYNLLAIMLGSLKVVPISMTAKMNFLKHKIVTLVDTTACDVCTNVCIHVCNVTCTCGHPVIENVPWTISPWNIFYHRMATFSLSLSCTAYLCTSIECSLMQYGPYRRLSQQLLTWKISGLTEVVIQDIKNK